jgi:hypothetical protein
VKAPPTRAANMSFMTRWHLAANVTPPSPHTLIGVLWAVCFTGIMSDDLKAFLEVTLPKVKEGKKSKVMLGVTEPKLGAAILEVCGAFIFTPGAAFRCRPCPVAPLQEKRLCTRCLHRRGRIPFAERGTCSCTRGSNVGRSSGGDLFSQGSSSSRRPTAPSRCAPMQGRKGADVIAARHGGTVGHGARRRRTSGARRTTACKSCCAASGSILTAS